MSSFEGYYELLCQNGHVATMNVYDFDALYADYDDFGPLISFGRWQCRLCGAALQWWNIVDQTNDEGQATKFVVKDESETSQCSACGCVKTIKERTFFMPDSHGHTVVP